MKAALLIPFLISIGSRDSLSRDPYSAGFAMLGAWLLLLEADLFAFRYTKGKSRFPKILMSISLLLSAIAVWLICFLKSQVLFYAILLMVTQPYGFDFVFGFSNLFIIGSLIYVAISPLIWWIKRPARSGS